MGVDPGLSGHNLVRDLADKMGGRYSYFNAPAVAASAEEADALLSTPEVMRSLEFARQANVAFLGIGSFPTDTTRTFLDLAGATKAEVSEAKKKKVVGQFAGRFCDANGEQVDLAIHRRLVSLDLAGRAAYSDDRDYRPRQGKGSGSAGCHPRRTYRRAHR